MSDADRELRDRLEAAQSELKRALSRLDELENVAADREVLRQQLDVAQADLKQANERLDELEGQSTEELQAVLDEVTQDRDLLRQRLEQADKTREQWDHKVSDREAELAKAHAEAWRVNEELSSLRAELLRAKDGGAATQENPSPALRLKPRPWIFAMPALAGLAAATALLMRSCA